MQDKKTQESDDSAFQRVVGYFLKTPKTEDGVGTKSPKKVPRGCTDSKRPSKPSTKPKKRS